MSEPTAWGISRRQALGGAAAAAGGALLAGGAAAEAKAVPAKRVDVVVVGAGLAGLSAATDLVARRALRRAARGPRPGRRADAQPHAARRRGEVVEIGGQWVGPGQDRVLARAKQHHIRTFKTYTKGAQIFDYPGHADRFTGLIPPLPEPDAADFNQLLGEDHRAAGDGAARQAVDRARTPPRSTGRRSRPGSSPTRPPPGARFVFDLAIRAVFAAEPRDMSLLHALFYLQLGQRDHQPDQHRRRRPGLALRRRLAARLDPHGRARWASGWSSNAPVRRIAQSRAGVTVTSDAGTWHAKRVVVAIAPTLAGRIDYDPALPAARDQLTQRMPQGSVIKYEAVYPTPFWRAEGLSGYTNSDRAPICLTYDNSPPSGKPGVLLGFAAGSAARRLTGLSASARRAEVLGAFSRCSAARSLHPKALIEQNWSDEPWTRGCYAGYLPPGAWSDFGAALRAPVGRIHWAGTETAEVFTGYMDGAVRSGRAGRGRGP